MDILHASFRAPCNRLYFISWFSWDRDPSHRAESRAWGGLGQDSQCGSGLQPLCLCGLISVSRYTLSLGNVWSHLPFLPQTSTLTHNGCQFTLDSDKYVQTDRQRQLLDEFTPRTRSNQNARKKLSICQRTCKSCVLHFTIAFVLNFVFWLSRNWAWIVFISLGHGEEVVTHEDHLVLLVSVWSAFKKNTWKSIFILILLQSDSAASSINSPSHFIFRAFYVWLGTYEQLRAHKPRILSLTNTGGQIKITLQIIKWWMNLWLFMITVSFPTKPIESWHIFFVRIQVTIDTSLVWNICRIITFLASLPKVWDLGLQCPSYLFQKDFAVAKIAFPLHWAIEKHL